MKAIAVSQELQSLARLILRDTLIDDEGVIKLIASRALNTLETLDLTDSKVCGKRWDEAEPSKEFEAHLGILILTGTGINDEGIIALCDCKLLRELEMLDASRTGVTGRGLSAVAKSQEFVALDEVRHLVALREVSCLRISWMMRPLGFSSKMRTPSGWFTTAGAGRQIGARIGDPANSAGSFLD